MARRKNHSHKLSTTTTTTSSRSAVAKNKPPTAATKDRRPTNAERSAVFGRREAAKVLKTVLSGDAKRRALASIKSLVYSPSVRNKKSTFALVCQTLKYLPLLKDVLETSDVLNSKWKKQQELMYIITYDVLFGKLILDKQDVKQEISSFGTGEKFLLQRKAALESALAKILVKKKVKNVEDLLSLYEPPDVPKPRYVRVNTLKLDVDSAVNELAKLFTVHKDDLVPDLLILPPGVDLHDHPLVTSGSVFLQGKASSMVAVALGPQPGWEELGIPGVVLDACSAPGNKTVHLSALMKGKGKIVACELNRDRVKLLQNTVRAAGANSILVLSDLSFTTVVLIGSSHTCVKLCSESNGTTDVEVHHGDFLDINPNDPTYSKFRAILLDPSCSGSGTAAQRLDHLLPSHKYLLASIKENQAGASDIIRQTKLASFQKKALEHALSCKNFIMTFQFSDSLDLEVSTWVMSWKFQSCLCITGRYFPACNRSWSMKFAVPSVERIVYSTCSIHQIENEDVIKSVLPLASKNGFELATPFPQWHRRGLPVFEGSQHVLRTDPVEEKEGFFIALFVRKNKDEEQPDLSKEEQHAKHLRTRKKQKQGIPVPLTRLSKMWLLSLMSSSSSSSCRHSCCSGEAPLCQYEN
ncbi:hypothetical protein RDABS01_038683 [Bienertia sinuspersici]